MPEADLCGEEDKDAEACSTGPGTEHLGIGMIGVLCSSFKENKTNQNKYLCRYLLGTGSEYYGHVSLVTRSHCKLDNGKLHAVDPKYVPKPTTT